LLTAERLVGGEAQRVDQASDRDQGELVEEHEADPQFRFDLRGGFGRLWLLLIL